MILDMKPLNLAEVKMLVETTDENKDLLKYLKKYGKLDKPKADSLTNELIGLNNMKLKNDIIVKIVDFLPKDNESLNKIFTEIGLDDKEAQEILEIVKKY
jgi:DNA-directed RNA polymerase subunit F